jgi:TonB-linked SusC/RagA family outer membrane protein
MRESKSVCLTTRWGLAIIVFFVSLLPAAAQQKIPAAVKVSISKTNVSLKEVLKEIGQQTGTRFFYADRLLNATEKVSVRVTNKPLQELLDQLLTDQKLNWNYNAQQKTIEVVAAPEPAGSSNNSIAPGSNTGITVSGKVTNTTGGALSGTYVLLKGTTKGVVTTEAGEFSITNVPANGTLVFKNVGYKDMEVPVLQKTYVTVSLGVEENILDETIVQAYGTTTRRYNTGNISKITSKEIEQQPISNPLSALEGRVPGVVVTPTKGLPGAMVQIQIRGKSSITQGSDPYFIIDGVPFAPNNKAVNLLTSSLSTSGGAVTGGLSPFSSINPADIESIEILKDADALSIYGSRGANGVILITTKKGKSGKVKANISFYNGLSYATGVVKMMNTQEYRQLRKEAFANDGVTPTKTNAPDLTVFDSTRYTDFTKFLIKPAHSSDAQVNISGGSTTTQFSIGTGFHRETTVFSSNTANNKYSFHSNLNHSSADNRLNISQSTMFSYEKNNLLGNDLANYVTLPPNTPELVDSVGNINWQKDGVVFANPFPYQLQKYEAVSENLVSNVQVSYKIINSLIARVSIGYNSFNLSEKRLLPIAAANPANSPKGAASFGRNSFKSWIIEPQLEYNAKIGNGKLSILIGSSLQEQVNNGSSISASGYTNDALLESLAAATTVIGSNVASKYHYQAGFGRINYNYAGKYILNLTGRRDGSSRFGPGRQFGNFGAVGGAWIMSSEPFLAGSRIVSFSKIRASYGITGNDQIGDYNYLDLWTNIAQPYNGSPGLYPIQLFNPEYEWEVNKKIELAIEVGLFKDRIYLSSAIYRNRSGNQLINYTVPTQAGFASITAKNFPAVLENSGIEISLSTKNIQSKNLKWTTNFNFSIPKNKLVSFPGLAKTSYANTLIEGKSISSINALNFLGVDPVSGIFKFEDRTNDALYNRADYIYHGNKDPKFIGGIYNSFSFKNWQFDFLIEGKKQINDSYLRSIYESFYPGSMNNMPAALASRWKKGGDNSVYEKSTANFGTPAQATLLNFQLSNGIFSEILYARLKTVSLSYSLPENILKRIKVSTVRFYLLAQNLFVVSNAKGADPQALTLFSTPPLKTIVGGFQFSF